LSHAQGENVVRITFRTALLMLAGLTAAAVLMKPWRLLPDHWNPDVLLHPDDPMNPVTQMKLSALRDAPEQCLAILAAAPEHWLDYLPLADYTPVEDCPLRNVVRVRNSGVRFNAPFTATCPLTVRWLMFERQQLQPLAMEILGSPVDEVEHFGTFACRNVYNRQNGRRSQHASASAIDVAAFVLKDGTRISVLRDWDNEDSPEHSRFLKGIHRAACGYFGTVLGPDYNQPHENHFHLDTSGFGLCR
jgi:hypothetical protein